MEKKHTGAKIVRVVTAPPFMALALVVILWLKGLIPPDGMLWAALFLTVLPLLAYPVWKIVPALEKKGRDSQRKLAVIFSVAGYLIGTALCLIAGRGRLELILYLTYLASGLLVALFSYAVHIKGSGHAAGVAGPTALLIFLLGPWYALGFVILALVYWCSLVLKRHTLSQLILGSILSPASAILLLLFLP